MRIYLIRHGQTTSDIEDRLGGDYDDHLTETGRKQSETLAREIANFGIEKIFCSFLIRARETTNILKKEIRCEIEIVEDLRERNRYGILTGMKITEAKEKYPNLVELLDDYHTNIEGGEPYESFRKRVEKYFLKILKSKYNAIAVVTHAGPIRVIFREILKAGNVKVEDCGFAELESFDGKLKIVKLSGVNFKK
jgi:broad specificity phosphatase PhoE